MSSSTITPACRRSILNLYSSSLRASNSFSSYNFRNYFIAKTKETFRDMQAESDAAKVRAMYEEAKKELAVLRRSAIVNKLYGGWRLSVEAQQTQRDPEVVKERGDN